MKINFRTKLLILFILANSHNSTQAGKPTDTTSYILKERLAIKSLLDQTAKQLEDASRAEAQFRGTDLAPTYRAIRSQLQQELQLFSEYLTMIDRAVGDL